MQKMCILFFMLVQSGFIEAMDSFSVIKNSDCKNGKISADRPYIYAAACFNEAITELNEAAMGQNKLNVPKIDGIKFDEQGDVRYNATSILNYVNKKREGTNLNSELFERSNDDGTTEITDLHIESVLQEHVSWLLVFNDINNKVNFWKRRYEIKDQLHDTSLADLCKTEELNNALKFTSLMYQLFMGTVIAVQFAYIFYLKKYK